MGRATQKSREPGEGDSLFPLRGVEPWLHLAKRRPKVGKKGFKKGEVLRGPGGKRAPITVWPMGER